LPTLKSSRKRLRQNIKARTRNRAARSTLRTVLKRVRTATDRAQAVELLPDAISLIDRTARRGVIHQNAAGRYKSKLTRHVNSLA
jgi:small subunit ribosomal protein S20